jgi:tRNA threonylcarbamoyladenosine biosynthesis protein TsaE
MIEAPNPSVAARSVAVITRSADQTRELAATLARVARPGDRLALVGGLGAGKTQFAKGYAAGLGVIEVVNSPSFTLMAEYRGRLPLYHQDLYRLAGAEEILAGGLVDERTDEGVTLSEWADRLDGALDPERLLVRFTLLGESERRIDLVDAPDGRYRAYLEAAAAWAAGRA